MFIRKCCCNCFITADWLNGARIAIPLCGMEIVAATSLVAAQREFIAEATKSQMAHGLHRLAT